MIIIFCFSAVERKAKQSSFFALLYVLQRRDDGSWIITHSFLTPWTILTLTQPAPPHSWSRNSRYVLTASKDWNCIVWDLASDLEPLQRSRTIRFDVPLARASFHPLNRRVCICICYTHSSS